MMSHQIEGSGKGKEIIGGNGSGGDDGCSGGGDGKKTKRPRPAAGLVCPRCQSRNSKFCYYNNGSIYQPRYYCSECRRYWTEGGIQRNIPVGGPNRRQRRSASDSSPVSVIVLALPPDQQRQLLAATATAASWVTAMHQPTLNALPRPGFGTNLDLVSNSLQRPQQQLNPYPHPGVQQQQQEPQEDDDMSKMGDGSAFVDDWLDISAFTNDIDNNNAQQVNHDLTGKEAST